MEPFQDDRNAYISKLLAGQENLFVAYQALLSQVAVDSTAGEICSGHLSKLTELTESLADYNSRLLRQEQLVQVSVA